LVWFGLVWIRAAQLTLMLCWNLKRKLGGRERDMMLSGVSLPPASEPLLLLLGGGGGLRRLGCRRRRSTTPPPLLMFPELLPPIGGLLGS
jgi:hypothetical protein